MLKPEDLQPDKIIMPPDIPWYKKKSCLFLLFFFILIIVGISVFGWYVYKYSKQIKKGEVPQEIINLFPEKNNSSSREIVTRDDDPWQGNENAIVTVIAFEDFQCPISGQTYPILKKVFADYQDKVLFVYRDFPTKYDYSNLTSEAAQCAYEQGYFWEFHDLLYLNQSTIAGEESLYKLAEETNLNVSSFKQCLSSGRYEKEVQKDFFDGKLAGVSGTPTFFINGYKLEGSYSEEFWREALDYMLEKQLTK